jgi:uncharacterized protein
MSIHPEPELQDPALVPAAAAPSREPVTLVIHRVVRRGMEREFEAWIRGVGSDAAHYDGYLGSNIIPPRAGSREYTFIMRFDSYDHLMTWETSEERLEWLERVQPLVEGEVRVHRTTGLEYWFTLPDQPGTPAPAKWKMVLATWVALSCVVLIVPPVLQKLFAPLPWPAPQVLISGAMVVVMTFGVMPFVTRLLAPWLYRTR